MRHPRLTHGIIALSFPVGLLLTLVISHACVSRGVYLPAASELPGLDTGGGPGWDPGQFTDPRQYRTQGKSNPPFKFLVVSVLDPKLRESQHQMTTETTARELKIKVDPTRAIDITHYPERVADKRAMSASVIDDLHLQTWGDSGYIIRAPQENVIAAAPTDMNLEAALVPGVPAAKAVEILRQARQRYGTPSPRDLIARYIPNQYNEVSIAGRTVAGGDVKILAVFFKADMENGRELCDPVHAELLKSHAAKYKWPIVKILVRRPDEIRGRFRK